ncbi:hypothetical protein [Streptomyces alkaliterrae]|uniref:Zinc-finger domain-containing protein n=1 Tax=Streptomyces alkaliterrae TaxID=2213162 RepID=A0A5P0YU01_9ACTN|nr:hypothetical protein [Streptomyces alkaliterrae]MBB1257637.1 hypothetical protein [Streptomyces alkaliterrae]MQS03748.1 hypothetical protein [Streptomyces alkaliterrae]
MRVSPTAFDTNEHPEVAEISALTEGLLPPDRSADVTNHLNLCLLCADVRSSLEEIRGALGTLPGPVRMPEDIAGRIDAAIAAEALLDATAPGVVSRETTARETTTRETTERADAAPGETAPTEGGAVSRETAGATPSTGRPSNRLDGTRPDGGKRPGGSRPGGRSQRRGAARRRRTLIATLGVCAVALMAGLLLPPLLGDNGSNRSRDEVTAERSAPGTGPAPEELEKQVHELLALTPRRAPTETGNGAAPEQGEEPGEFSPKASPNGTFGAEQTVTLPECVAAAVNRTEAPLAATRQSHQGTDAYLVVLPHPGDSERVDAYVVDATCADRPADDKGTDPGRLLARHTVDRR